MFQNVQLANNGSDESIVLKTLCENKSLQSFILSKIDEAMFSMEAAKEVYKRISTYIQSGKSIPSIAVWKNDKSISDSARAIFANYEGVISSQEDMQIILENLRVARNKNLTLATFSRILSNMDKSENMDGVLSELEDLVQKCRDIGDAEEFKNYAIDLRSSLLEQADKQMSENVKMYAVPTGFSEFDNRTGGLFRKNVLVMASVPGGGKSAMALQMAIRQYMMGYNVCIVTYEMDLPEIDNRMYSNVSKVDHSEINLKKLDAKKKKLVLDRYGEFLESSKKGNKLTVWAPKRELTIPQIAIELKPKKYDIIYIDYLSLLYNNPKKAMWENLGEHTRAAKLAATQLDAVFVLLAQLDDETNKLKYSKAIQANANFVWTWEFGDKERESGIIEVQQRKSRNAPIYNFYLETDYSILSFKDYNGPTPFREENQQKPDVRKRKKDEPKPAAAAERKGIPKMPQLL